MIRMWLKLFINTEHDYKCKYNLKLQLSKFWKCRNEKIIYEFYKRVKQKYK